MEIGDTVRLTERCAQLSASCAPSEDTWQRSERLQHEVIAMVPTIEQSTSADSWTRDTGVYAVSEPGFGSTQLQTLALNANDMITTDNKI